MNKRRVHCQLNWKQYRFEESFPNKQIIIILTLIGICTRTEVPVVGTYVHVASVILALERFYLLTPFCDVRSERWQRAERETHREHVLTLKYVWNSIGFWYPDYTGYHEFLTKSLVQSMAEWPQPVENRHGILSSSEFVHYFRFESSASHTQSCWHLHITQCLDVQQTDQLLHSIPLWTYKVMGSEGKQGGRERI